MISSTILYANRRPFAGAIDFDVEWGKFQCSPSAIHTRRRTTDFMDPRSADALGAPP